MMIRRAPLVRVPRPATNNVPRRLISTPTPPRTRRPVRTTLLVTSISAGAVVLGLYADAKSCPSPPFKLAEPISSAQAVNVAHSYNTTPALSTLLRTYFVYGLTSFETVVDHAPEILSTLLTVPLVGTVVEGIVRRTFFGHFVGGETAREAYPHLSELRHANKGALFAYSVEVEQDEAAGASHHHDQEAGSSDHAGNQPVHKRIVAEMIRSIDVAADFEDAFGTRDLAGRRTWVAVKLTALLPNADALRNLSIHLTRTRPALNSPVPFPGSPESSDLAVLHNLLPEGSLLTAQDVEELKELLHDLGKICTRAKERRVRIILDAEHSWYQPAIDAFGHAMMERFNKLPEYKTSRWSSDSGIAQDADLQPLVYVTYQAYLRRAPTHLARSLALARQNNYALGVKLVRGAYHPHELSAHASASSTVSISPDPYPPVQPSKADTDACYNECASLLVRTIAEDIQSSSGSPPRAPHLGVLFGTHNWQSAELILGELVKNGLAHEHTPSTDDQHKGTLTVSSEVAERLTFGQLYGMSDSLTDYLVGRVMSSTPCVIKYVPYGALVEVMPYISRRAVENKSVLGNGGAVRERKEAARQIWNRVFGGIGL